MNMNRRIRHLGSSSKEICFQRDMVTNAHKPANDKKLASDINQARTASHNKHEPSKNEEFRVGMNVVIKSELSKLSARKPYRIINLFEKDGEDYATLQKHDSQFRAKQYKVKAAELIVIPNQPPTPKKTPPRRVRKGSRATLSKEKKCPCCRFP